MVEERPAASVPVGSMRWKRIASAITGALLSTSCASGVPGSITSHISRDYTPGHFGYCYAGGCQQGQFIAFAGADWQAVRAAFGPAADSAAAERDSMAAAVAILERAAGAIAGTSGDKGGTLFNGKTGQLDCFSEAANTTNFLGLIERDGLLRHHRVLGPEMRGLTHGRGGFAVHATAVVEEMATGARYVVDSWFFDNGVPPAVAPLDEWLAGWSPVGAAWL